MILVCLLVACRCALSVIPRPLRETSCFMFAFHQCQYILAFTLPPPTANFKHKGLNKDTKRVVSLRKAASLLYSRVRNNQRDGGIRVSSRVPKPVDRSLASIPLRRGKTVTVLVLCLSAPRTVNAPQSLLVTPPSATSIITTPLPIIVLHLSPFWSLLPTLPAFFLRATYSGNLHTCFPLLQLGLAFLDNLPNDVQPLLPTGAILPRCPRCTAKPVTRGSATSHPPTMTSTSRRRCAATK